MRSELNPPLIGEGMEFLISLGMLQILELHPGWKSKERTGQNSKCFPQKFHHKVIGHESGSLWIDFHIFFLYFLF